MFKQEQITICSYCSYKKYEFIAEGNQTVSMMQRTGFYSLQFFFIRTNHIRKKVNKRKNHF